MSANFSSTTTTDSRLYIRYRSSSMQAKQRSAKSLQTTPLWVNLTWTFQFCSSSFCLSSMLMNNLKTIQYRYVYMQILYSTSMYQRTALLQGNVLFWFGMAYKLRLASYSLETVAKDTCSRLDIPGAAVDVFWAWHVQSGHTLTDYWLWVLQVVASLAATSLVATTCE